MTASKLAVQDGRLTKLSPSQIETFDPNSTWGCEAKWYLENVMGLTRPPDASLETGNRVHAEVEAYLRGEGNGMGKEAMAGKSIIDKVKPFIVQIENWMQPKVFIRDIPVNGRIDIELQRADWPGILDWKTSSDIGRYAKNKEELKTSIQMMLYAWWLLEQRKDESACTVEHVYFQTKGRRAEQVGPVLLGREQVYKFVAEYVTPLVDRMIAAAKAKSAADVPGRLEKCGIARGCPHRAVCPHYQKQRQEEFDNDPLFADVEKNKMSLMDDFFDDVPAKAEPPPAARTTQADVDANTKLIEEHKAKQAQQAVEDARQKAKAALTAPAAPLLSPLPVDAPPSKPELAADPLPSAPVAPPAVAEAAPAKRGPGRPKKSMQIQDVPTLAEPVATSGPAPSSGAGPSAPVPSTTSFEVRRLAISQGLTINIGNFESARVDVTLEAVGNEDVETMRSKLTKLAREALKAEAEPYMKRRVVGK
jgi:hypothetical protein